MTRVVDTHAIVWFLEGNVRLSAGAMAAFRDQQARVVIPTIVLATTEAADNRRASKPAAAFGLS